MIKSTSIKFGLVGCGRIAQNHFKAIKDHAERAELVSICDIDDKVLKEAAKKTGAAPYNNYEEMLQQSKADIIVLCTPSGLHARQAIQAATAGYHVMTEKPMATNWEDGLSMVKVCKEEQVNLFVVKQNRKNKTLQLLRQAIEQNRFGKIYMVNINVFWTRPQEYYNMAAWRGTRAMDGGALMNQASHYVDLISWLIGPLDSIHAFSGTLGRQIEVEDTIALNLQWRSGVIGSMNVTMLTYPKNLEGSITILGEKGSVKVGGVAVNEIVHWEFSEALEIDNQVKQASYETTSVYGYGHPLYYDNVINVMNNKEKPDTDGEEGLKSLEVLIAAYESAKHSNIVRLPLPR